MNGYHAVSVGDTNRRRLVFAKDLFLPYSFPLSVSLCVSSFIYFKLIVIPTK